MSVRVTGKQHGIESENFLFTTGSCTVYLYLLCLKQFLFLNSMADVQLQNVIVYPGAVLKS
jgi:hypothetical protein